MSRDIDIFLIFSPFWSHPHRFFEAYVVESFAEKVGVQGFMQGARGGRIAVERAAYLIHYILIISIRAAWWRLNEVPPVYPFW